MNPKNFLLTFLAILFSFAIARGQNQLVIHLVDNSSVTTSFSDIQRITFQSDNMLLKTTSGAENSYMLDNITSITFLNKVGIEVLTEPVDINFFCK
jgi:hypothetical protein